MSNLTRFLPILLIIIFTSFRAFSFFNDLVSRKGFLYSDDAIYATLSQRFLNGDFLEAFHPYWNSGFPIATIPFYMLTKSWENAQFLLSISAMIVLIPIIYLTLKNISQFLAVIAAFIAAFSPSISKLVNSWGISEPIYLVWVWLAVYFGWQASQNRSFRNLMLTGIFFGLAYLTRTEAMFVLVGFLGFFTLDYLFEQRPKTPKISNKLSILSAIVLFLTYIGSLLVDTKLFTKTSLQYHPSARLLLFSYAVLAVVIFGFFFKKKKQAGSLILKDLVKKLFIILIFFFIVNLPYILVISTQLGRPALNGKYAVFGSGHQFTPEKDRLTTWAQDIWSIDFSNFKSIYYDPIHARNIAWKELDTGVEFMWKKIAANLELYKSKNIFTDSEFKMMAIGIILALMTPKVRKLGLYLLLIWLVSLMWISYAMEVSQRYLAFSFPLFYTFYAFFIWAIANYLSFLAPKKLKWLSFGLAGMLFLLFFTYQNNLTLKNFLTSQQGPVYYDQKQIGDFLRSKNINVIMARTEGISFYSGAKLVYLPAANPQTILKFAKSWGVEYILARPHETSWDYMKDISNPNFTHPDLKLTHQFDDGSLVWRVKLTEDEKTHNFRTDRDVNQKFDNINVDSQTKI